MFLSVDSVVFSGRNSALCDTELDAETAGSSYTSRRLLCEEPSGSVSQFVFVLIKRLKQTLKMERVLLSRCFLTEHEYHASFSR